MWKLLVVGGVAVSLGCIEAHPPAAPTAADAMVAGPVHDASGRAPDADARRFEAIDAARVDAGPLLDAEPDARQVADAAHPARDALPAPDARRLDASTPPDARAPLDAAPDARPSLDAGPSLDAAPDARPVHDALVQDAQPDAPALDAEPVDVAPVDAEPVDAEPADAMLDAANLVFDARPGGPCEPPDGAVEVDPLAQVDTDWMRECQDGLEAIPEPPRREYPPPRRCPAPQVRFADCPLAERDCVTPRGLEDLPDDGAGFEVIEVEPGIIEANRQLDEETHESFRFTLDEAGRVTAVVELSGRVDSEDQISNRFEWIGGQQRQTHVSVIGGPPGCLRYSGSKTHGPDGVVQTMRYEVSDCDVFVRSFSFERHPDGRWYSRADRRRASYELYCGASGWLSRVENTAYWADDSVTDLYQWRFNRCGGLQAVEQYCGAFARCRAVSLGFDGHGRLFAEGLQRATIYHRDAAGRIVVRDVDPWRSGWHASPPYEPSARACVHDACDCDTECGLCPRRP